MQPFAITFWLRDVFSLMVVISPTAHFVICVDLIELLCDTSSRSVNPVKAGKISKICNGTVETVI